MTPHQLASVMASVILGGLVVFQLLLAFGLPLGRAAWGGMHRVLPTKLRRASLAAVPVLGVAGWVVLARAGLMQPGAEISAIRFLSWAFGAYFTFNTVINALSKSPLERWIMTPVSTALVCCFVLVSIS